MNLSIPTSSVVTTPPVLSGSVARRPLLEPIPNTPGEFLMVIDNSSLEKFTTCPTSAAYYLVHGREPHSRNNALVFGGALHIGLEAFELGRSPDEQDAAITSFYNAQPHLMPDYRTLDVALLVMAHYRRCVPVMPHLQWRGLDDSRGPIVERAFELPLGVVEVDAPVSMPWLTPEQLSDQRLVKSENPTPSVHVSHIHVAWSGRIDRLAHCAERNRVCDHKTTSIGGDQVTSEYHLSNPMIGYTWAGRKLWPEHNPTGGCINFIHLKSPGVGKSTYSGGLMERGPRGGEPPLNFFRAYYDYSDERIAWWEQNALDTCSDFIANLVRGRFPSHTKWCIGKYKKCGYFDVCTNDSVDVRLRLLHSDLYRPVTWNPVADR